MGVNFLSKYQTRKITDLSFFLLTHNHFSACQTEGSVGKPQRRGRKCDERARGAFSAIRCQGTCLLRTVSMTNRGLSPQGRRENGGHGASHSHSKFQASPRKRHPVSSGRVWWGSRGMVTPVRWVLCRLFKSMWQTREVKLKQPHAKLRLLPASRRFHKARKPAVLGSREGEGAQGHTQEQLLVRHSWQHG